MKNLQPRLDNRLLLERDTVLESKKLAELHPTNDPEEAQKLLAQYSFMTSRGYMSPAEYVSLFEKCMRTNDFTDLVYAFADAKIDRWKKDGTNGTALEMSVARKEAIHELKEKQGHLSYKSMGTASVDDTPGWVFAAEEMMMSTGLSLSEIYTLLEKETKPPVVMEDRDIKNGIQGIHHEIEDLL